jgi:exodeoxyribonuclease VII small subunit
METKKKKSFEENLEALEDIVKKLENGDIPLDQAIEKFNEGVVLAGECNKILERANETITKLLNKDGKLEKFEIDK